MSLLTKSDGSWRFLRLTSGAIALLIFFPLITIALSWFAKTGEIWAHLAATSLMELVANTILLLLGVGTGSLLLGVPLAWLVANYQFPGRGLFRWALLAPLAIPAYVMGFVYVGLFESFGPVAVFFKNSLGVDYQFEIRSYWGVTFVLILSLFPYVYFISLNAFSTQGRKVLEVGRSLGKSPSGVFWTAALPLARPWIAGGLVLVAMETLADFGTVSIFVYDTFTTAIYKTWFAMFLPEGAAQLSSLLILLIIVVIFMEKNAEKRKSYFSMGSPVMGDFRPKLPSWRGWLTSLFAGGVVTLGFIVPIAQLLVWSASVWESEVSSRTWGYVANSLVLGACVAFVTVLCSLILSLALRFTSTKTVRLANDLASLGYALPGPVLAVGVFLPLAWFDHRLADFIQTSLNVDVGLVFTSTALIMILGLTIRFLAVSQSVLSAALRRLSKRLDEAGQTLGVNGLSLVKKVHLPLLKSSIFTAAILVFVDVMKEMPLTLMTRPLGWDTLAVKIFEFTSEGEWKLAALPAVLLSLIGLIPIALLSRQTRNDV